MATIKCVIVPPDGAPYATEIESELGAFQAVVGGYIEAVMTPRETIYVNEEGILMGLPLNANVSLFASKRLGHTVHLFGSALIVGHPDGEGRDTDVHQDVLNYYNLEN